MIAVSVHIAEKDRSMVDAVDHDIDLAVVEQIAKSRPAGRNDIGETGAFDSRNRRKFLTAKGAPRKSFPSHDGRPVGTRGRSRT